MQQRVTKFTKHKVTSIINALDMHIPFAYTQDTLKELRRKGLYNEFSDEQLIQKIMNVRNLRSYHLDIALAIDKITRAHMTNAGVAQSLDDLSDEISKSLNLK